MTRPAGKGDAAGQEAQPPRCIVWLAPDQTTPQPLLTALARRGVKTAVAVDAPSVMYQLAIKMTVAIAVVEPAKQHHLHLRELVSAVQRYYPQTHFWQYEARGPQGQPCLTGMDVDGRQESTAATEVTTAKADVTQADSPHVRASQPAPFNDCADKPAELQEQSETPGPETPLAKISAGAKASDDIDTSGNSASSTANAADTRDTPDEQSQRNAVSNPFDVHQRQSEVASLTPEELAMLLGVDEPE